MYYGIMFLGGNRTCTTGTPNEKTGHMSIACTLHAFKTKVERDSWEGRYRDDNKEKISINASEIRKYKRGHSIEEMEEEVKMAVNEYECTSAMENETEENE